MELQRGGERSPNKIIMVFGVVIQTPHFYSVADSCANTPHPWMSPVNNKALLVRKTCSSSRLHLEEFCGVHHAEKTFLGERKLVTKYFEVHQKLFSSSGSTEVALAG